MRWSRPSGRQCLVRSELRFCVFCGFKSGLPVEADRRRTSAYKETRQNLLFLDVRPYKALKPVCAIVWHALVPFWVLPLALWLFSASLLLCFAVLLLLCLVPLQLLRPSLSLATSPLPLSCPWPLPFPFPLSLPTLSSFLGPDPPPFLIPSP